MSFPAIVAPRPEVYNSGLALELIALTVGLAALFVLIRSILLRANRKDPNTATGLACFTVGAAGVAALTMGDSGLWVCAAVGAAGFALALGLSAYDTLTGRTLREREAEAMEREERANLESEFSAQVIARNNERRAASELKKIGRND